MNLLGLNLNEDEFVLIYSAVFHTEDVFLKRIPSLL